MPVSETKVLSEILRLAKDEISRTQNELSE
jgi:hypothetical protein